MGSATGLFKEGDVRKQIPQLEAKIAKAPNDGNSRYALGEAYHRLGDYDKAQEQLEKAAQLLPQKPEVFYLLAWNSGVKQGWESAAVEENAKRALALNPRSKQAEALLHLSKGVQSYLFRQSGANSDSGLGEFMAAIELDPKNAYGYFYAGSVYESAEELEQAADYFQKAAELSLDDIAPGKEDARLFARVGVLNYKLKNYDSAKKFLTDAVKLDPGNSAAQELLDSINGG
jgi:tetratricopeptide (TPR) repeat protein